jgi:hypothetical protein
MPQVYNLDLETMLSTLSRRQLSGSLVADVPRGRVGREPAHIQISVDSGKVVSCSLQSGQTYSTGENVLQILARLDIIPWIFTASSPQQSLAPSPQSLVPIGEVSQARIPRRFGTLQQTDLARLPRTHFQVYAYIDGNRTVEEIAQHLRTTPQQIERVLLDLQTWKVVQYR